MSSSTDEYDCPSQDRVFFALLAFITPILAGIFLPWWSVLWLIVSLLFAVAIMALVGYPEIAKKLAAPLFMLLIGFAFQLWGMVSGWQGFFVGLFILLFSSIHLMLWMQFLGLESPRLERNLDLRFQGQVTPLVAAPRSTYIPRHVTAWLSSSADGFSWVIDTRAAKRPLAGVDQWSPHITVRVDEDSSSGSQPAAAVSLPAQEADRPSEVDADGHLLFMSPQDRHVLRGEAFMPEDDQAASGYRLWLDEQPTGLLLEAGAPVLWRDDGQALVCQARAESQSVAQSTTWLWHAPSAWQPLDAPWQSLDDEPLLEWGAPSRLEEARLVYEALLKPRAEPCEAQSLSLCVELQGEQAGSVTLQLAAMQGGARPCLHLQRKSRDGRRHAFSCSIGAWQLPGLWCLDQRISDCGRYLALIAFAEAPAVPYQLVVADVLARRLLRLEAALLIAKLETFEDGVLSVQQIVGRQASSIGTGPLPQLEALPPEAEQADAFVARGRLHYQTVRVAVEPWSLHVLPNWRLQVGPVLAQVQGDYVLPAPDGQDAAWLFGLDEGAEAAPGGACVLTASGCAVADLAPSMIWSADGRYLALSRRVFSEEGVRWHLLLLDTQEHTLRQSSQALGGLPCLEAFDAAGLHVRNEQQAGVLITYEALMALPRQMLIRSGDIWLPAEQLSDAAHWQHLDRRHLQPWSR